MSSRISALISSVEEVPAIKESYCNCDAGLVDDGEDKPGPHHNPSCPMYEPPGFSKPKKMVWRRK